MADFYQTGVVTTLHRLGTRSLEAMETDLNAGGIQIPAYLLRSPPNGTLSRRPNIKTVMNVGVPYDTPAEKIEQAMQIIEDIYRPHPKTEDLIISFNKFESSSLNILVVHWWNSTDLKEYLLQFQTLNLELKRRFDTEGISFAFPTQTLYLKQDSEWGMANLNSQAAGNGP